MILVLAGTRDGRELAAALAGRGQDVIVSVISPYGRQLAAADRLRVIAGALDAGGIADLIRSEGVGTLVDATHPYALNASVNAMAAARETGVRYIRYERPPSPLPETERVHRVPDMQSAARTAAGLGQTVFLTVGSRGLACFRGEPALAGRRLVARVLPDPEVVTACRELGFSPRDIVAMQGPFSHRMNVALLAEFGADVLVTKNSGSLGGTDSKYSAAAELGIPLVVVDRPRLDYGAVFHTREEIIEACLEGSQ